MTQHGDETDQWYDFSGNAEKIEAALTEYVRGHLRREYERGEELALLDCVVICSENHISLPFWALRALASAFTGYLSEKNAKLEEQLFGKRRGRHAKLATARRERAEHLLWFDIVAALEARGHKGSGIYDSAASLLRRYSSPAPGVLTFSRGRRGSVEAETIRQTCERMKRQGYKSTPLAEIIGQDIDDWK